MRHLIDLFDVLDVLGPSRCWFSPPARQWRVGYPGLSGVFSTWFPRHSHIRHCHAIQCHRAAARDPLSDARSRRDALRQNREWAPPLGSGKLPAEPTQSCARSVAMARKPCSHQASRAHEVDTVGGKIAMLTTSAFGPHPENALDTWVASYARPS
jgi:hypothetical protein